MTTALAAQFVTPLSALNSFLIGSAVPLNFENSLQIAEGLESAERNGGSSDATAFLSGLGFPEARHETAASLLRTGLGIGRFLQFLSQGVARSPTTDLMPIFNEWAIGERRDDPLLLKKSVSERLDVEQMSSLGFAAMFSAMVVLTAIILPIVYLGINHLVIRPTNPFLGFLAMEGFGIGALIAIDRVLRRHNNRLERRRNARDRLDQAILHDVNHGDAGIRNKALQGLFGLLNGYSEEVRKKFQERLGIPLLFEGGPPVSQIPSPAPLVSGAQIMTTLLGNVPALNGTENPPRKKAYQVFVSVRDHLSHADRFALLMALDGAGVETQEALDAAFDLFAAIPEGEITQLAAEISVYDEASTPPLLHYLKNRGPRQIDGYRTFCERLREVQGEPV